MSEMQKNSIAAEKEQSEQQNKLFEALAAESHEQKDLTLQLFQQQMAASQEGTSFGFLAFYGQCVVVVCSCVVCSLPLTSVRSHFSFHRHGAVNRYRSRRACPPRQRRSPQDCAGHPSRKQTAVGGGHMGGAGSLRDLPQGHE